MIIALNQRYGLDVKLFKIQNYLDKKIDAVIYGQLHENEKNNGRILEWSLLEKEVFVDDKEGQIIGFRVLNKSVDNYTGIASIDCISTLQTDNREFAEMKLYKTLANCGYVNSITNIKTGVNDVFSGLNNENINYRDIYPFHVFSYTIEVNYNYDLCI